MDTPNTPWPKHPDGRPMRLGEMTKEQRREQTLLAVRRVATEIKANEKRIAKILDDFK